MDIRNLDSDQVVAYLTGMGFELLTVSEAVKAVGPSIEDALEFILTNSGGGGNSPSTSMPKDGSSRITRKMGNKMRQSRITEHLNLGTKSKTRTTSSHSVTPELKENVRQKCHVINSDIASQAPEPVIMFPCKDMIGEDWEEKVKRILNKHFGYSALKSFQKEALEAWLAHKDCLVLAATGSGKSLCFQIPSLLTGKVVIVISPLISLMHDQCLKLAKHGVSACFLGSGQIDKSVEQKAMDGMYDIVYVCPETILRLIDSLQNLAACRGIALFAIDEVHCVSKWGHDFRPDYRRLSVLRETFKAEKLKFLMFDIPLVAVTATATFRVREDILKSLCMSDQTKIVVTSFFRPNLRFSVKHSKTSSVSSYKRDFEELIAIYTKRSTSGKRNYSSMLDMDDASVSSTFSRSFEHEESYEEDIFNSDISFSDDDELALGNSKSSPVSEPRKLSVGFLEDECDHQVADDFDVSCGEFSVQYPKDFSSCSLHAFPTKPDKRLQLQHGPVDEGSAIIYVPTRKETLSIANFLCRFGVKAAAYNAKLPKSHLRKVHMQFHEDAIQVVVATIAFGMGIDKLNVRRIIHYGWPQSLEAYYQEAGRAGRDGKLAECVLYANLFQIPTLLPSKRSEEQARQACKMLSDCFRYGISSSHCRAKMLVEYFGEEFQDRCLLCDVCVNGPPEIQNLRAEVMALMKVIHVHYRQQCFGDASGEFEQIIHLPNDIRRRRYVNKANIKTLVRSIREQYAEFAESDLVWWRGLSRILENKGFIREGDDKMYVQVKFPEPTELGLKLLRSEEDQPFYVHLEADMQLSMKTPKSNSSFSEWGRGWADPEIRRQRLGKKTSWRKPKQRKSQNVKPNLGTVRGRLTAKLCKPKT
ncbi:DNA helicase [Lithospermum erythrorhizon]|uniref:ATP-dependent DNA helicase n=1 Tax=Lithospermum erythrorhizon TaxID=34254 RepID=A0AAV3R0T7_LITER